MAVHLRTLAGVLLAVVTATANAAVPVVLPASSYQPPVDGPIRVTREFAPPAEPWLPGHRGVDLAAVPGTSVRAAGPGLVSYAGPLAGRGVVSVVHPHGLRTTYEPVDARVLVHARVAAGQPLGRLAAGHAGCPARACLHWGLRQEEAYLDPLALLGLARVRLLPAARPGPQQRG